MMNSVEPYISVIIPAHNAQAFIAFALQSVMAQPFRELEILVMNDFSTDATLDVCRCMAEKDERIRVFNLERCGAGAARNTGIRNARGYWIMFLDSDDVFVENAVSSMFVDALVKYERSRMEVIFTPTAFCDFDLKKNLTIRDLETEPGIIPHTTFWGCIYSRTFLIDQQVFFYEYQKQDVETAFRFLTKIKAKYISADEHMLFYLQRNNPKSNTHTWDIQVLSDIKARIYYDLLQKYSLNTGIHDELLRICLGQVKAYYYSCKIVHLVRSKDSLIHMNKIYHSAFLSNLRSARRLFGFRWVMGAIRDYMIVNFCTKKTEVSDEQSAADSSFNDALLSVQPDLFERYRRASAFLLDNCKWRFY